jgi:flagellar hook assembly protein FlgD
MKTNAFRKLGQGLLAAILLTIGTQVSSFGQSLANATPPTSLAPAGLEAVVYQVPETTKFKVHFLNHSENPVTVRLLDANNQVIYSESITAKNYLRKFDLENLSDGNYRFEISNGKQRIKKEVGLQTVTARSVQAH